MSLSEQARTGLREMPSNAAWLLSRVLKPAQAVETTAESATAGARDQGRKVKAAVVDATPFGGDSVDVRMRRAQDAGERAREAEERAAEAAHESKERSAHARDVSEHGRARLREADRETNRMVKQRIADAQKAAEALVERERRAAEADAEEQRQQVQAEVDQEVQAAQADAEDCRQRAEELIEDATEKLTEARRLAGEAAEAARTAADEASRRAQSLASEAQQQAHDAQAQVKATERLRERTQTTARRTARELESDDGGLQSHSKAELVQLAASVGIESRTKLTKSELADAIAKASRAGR
jgi:DNA repair exonuclease SbcCD ATPase subunit